MDFLTDDPYSGINFVKTRAQIKDKNGNLIFDEEVTFPDYFDENSVNIVTSKYLCNNAKKKETDLRQLIDRVSETISTWGWDDYYFTCGTDVNDHENNINNRKIFENKLKYYQINQYFAFNSPCYFNIGLREVPQTSACFILPLEDSLESIYDCVKLESQIFKHGSGSGINLSNLRSSKEKVREGGYASGVNSFWKVLDVSAGVIKSGGTLRRSAKLQCLNDNHPDIWEFISAKEKEEKKLQVLQEAKIEPRDGYEMSDEVFYQNTNISVQLSDDFMEAVEKDETWSTKYVLTGQTCETFPAKKLLYSIAELAWKTADPGVQFSDTINKGYTCSSTGRVEASNPCSEFMAPSTFNVDGPEGSACNLASINLLKFFSRSEDGTIKFDVELFEDVVSTVIFAQDIIIDRSSFPSEGIKNSAQQFRDLGLGYTNLGSTLMYLGVPYDSEEGRSIAASLTSLLTGYALKASVKLAEIKGPFKWFQENKQSYYNVITQQFNASRQVIHVNNFVAEMLMESQLTLWDVINTDIIFSRRDIRNSQLTLLAPTGTISFLMMANSFGIEPFYSNISYKTLSGQNGATIKIVNPMIKEGLVSLNYGAGDIKLIETQIEAYGYIKEDDWTLDVNNLLDTAADSGNGRSIHYMGHLKMMAAVQPFLNGAISKTCNVPKETTVDEIYNIYLDAWKMGIKAVAVYRDGCKVFQPLNTKKKEELVEIKYDGQKCEYCYDGEIHPEKRSLPQDREAMIHRFKIGGSLKGYITMGLYPDGSLGEIFVNLGKAGSLLSGVIDACAVQTSVALQFGIPLKDIIEKMIFTKFEPSGITSSNQNELRFCSSILDYIYRFLAYKFLTQNELYELGLINGSFEEKRKELETNVNTDPNPNPNAPMCDNCGNLKVKLGACWTCHNCGDNSGSCG